MLIPDMLTYPYFFIISLGIIILFLMIFLGKKGVKNFSNMSLLREVYGVSSYGYFVCLCCIFTISFLFVTLLAGPYISESIQKERKNGIDIEIVLDLSISMDAQDIAPSRLESAKSSLLEFVSEIESDRIGVILFAGKAFQSVPLSFDYAFVRDFLSELSLDIFDSFNPSFAGTAIGDGLLLGHDTLQKEQPKREKIMILITDGEANTGIDPLIAARLAAESGIKIYTIGVGKNASSFVDIVTPTGFIQRVPVGPVDEATLKEIANISGGKYYRASDNPAFEKVLQEIASLEKTELEQETIVLKKPVYGIFFILLLLCYMVLGYVFLYKKIYF